MRTRDARVGPTARPSVLIHAAVVALLVAASAAAQAPPPPAPDEPAEVVDLGALEQEGAAAGAKPDGEAPDELPAEGSDTMERLEAGSGVRVETICTNCNQASLTMNGLTGEHVLVSFDGVPAVGGLGTVYQLVQYPGYLVGSSHVERGPGSVLSGAGAIGGHIEFRSLPRTRARRALLDVRAGDWGTKQLVLGGAQRWGRFGALGAVQGVVQNEVDANGDGGNEVGEFDRMTAHGIFDVHLTDHQVLTFSGLFYGESQIDGPGRPIPTHDVFLDEDAVFNWRQFTAGWTLEKPSGLTLTWRSRYSRRFQQQASAAFPGRTERPYLQVEDERAFGRFEMSRPVGASGLITAGVGWDRLRLAVLNKETFDQFVIDGLEHLEGYVQHDRSLGARTDVTVGVRYDAFTVFGKTQLTGEDPDLHSSFLLPRAQLSLRATPKLVLSWAAGRGAVGPTPVMEKTCCGATYKRSRDVRPERSWSYQFLTEVHPTPDMRVTGTLFWTDFKDYVHRIVEKAAFAVPKYANVNVPEARVRGVELVHDMRFADDVFNVGWTYGYVDAEDQHGEWLPFTPHQAASTYFRYSDRKRGTKVSFDARWKGRLRHFDIPFSTDEITPTPTRSSVGFLTADVSYEQRIGKKGWALQAGVNNITDYVQEDLSLLDADASGYRDQFERSYDWGPITGRFAWIGAKFNL